MGISVASVDAGNLGANAATITESGKVKTVYSPCIRAIVNPQELKGNIGIGTMEFDWTEWNGRVFTHGDDVARSGAKTPEIHQEDQRHGNEFHQFMTALMCAKLGAQTGDEIRLVIFIPPGLFKDEVYRKEIERIFLDNPPSIRLKGDKKPREFCYVDVLVLPECIGIPAILTWDEKGVARNHELMLGRTLFMDGGAHTFDVLELTNGKLNLNNLQYATFNRQGLMTHVYMPILTHYNSRYSYINMSHVDAAIRRGLVTGQFVLDPENLNIDITTSVNELAYDYAQYIANAIIGPYYNSLGNVRAAFVQGGVWPLCGKHLLEMYKVKRENKIESKILDYKRVEALQKIEPVNTNAIGGLRIALALALAKS